MKTAEEVFEKIIRAYLDSHGDKKAGTRALLDWGRELCEEQKRIVKSQGLILDAPLPEILKDK